VSRKSNNGRTAVVSIARTPLTEAHCEFYFNLLSGQKDVHGVSSPGSLVMSERQILYP